MSIDKVVEDVKEVVLMVFALGLVLSVPVGCGVMVWQYERQLSPEYLKKNGEEYCTAAGLDYAGRGHHSKILCKNKTEIKGR